MLRNGKTQPSMRSKPRTASGCTLIEGGERKLLHSMFLVAADYSCLLFNYAETEGVSSCIVHCLVFE